MHISFFVTCVGFLFFVWFGSFFIFSYNAHVCNYCLHLRASQTVEWWTRDGEHHALSKSTNESGFLLFASNR